MTNRYKAVAFFPHLATFLGTFLFYAAIGVASEPTEATTKCRKSSPQAVSAKDLRAFSPSSARPNIVLLIADDQGYADFSAYENAAPDIVTPNLDRLAAEGVRFTQAYVTASVCSPSRCGLMTGRYQQRWGVQGYATARLPETEITLAQIFQQHGYATGKIGKTHYGKHDPLSYHFPLRHGFDHFYGFMHHTKHYLRHTVADARRFQGGNFDAGPLYIGETKQDQRGYSTELFQREALSFIDRHRHKPFFLMVSFNAVHLFVNQLPASDLEEARIPQADNWNPEKEPGKKGYLAWYYRTLKKHGNDPQPHDPHGRARYRIALDYLDQAVGAILDKLEEHGLAENTLVVYLSDNGGSPRTYSRNEPLRDYKYSLYEGGIRVPMVVRWPAKLPEAKVFREIVSALDLFPTLAAAAGVPLPGDRPYDGINLLPRLQKAPVATENLVSLQNRTLFWTMGQEKTTTKQNRSWAVRRGPWKLSYRPGFGTALYNLSKDIGESQDLAANHPEIVDQLAERYDNWICSIETISD